MIKTNDVLIVDDHPLYAEALQHVLGYQHPGWDIQLAYSAEQGLKNLDLRAAPFLILLDPGLPGLSGAEAAKAFARECPEAIIVAVSAADDRRQAAALFQAGVRACFSKGLMPARFTELLEKVLAGELPPSTQITADGACQILHESLPALSPRQREILVLLNQGLPNKEIALRLKVAEATVKAHIAVLFRSLGVSNRTQAVMAAHHYGWLHARESRTAAHAAATRLERELTQIP
ncbi:MAG TPA: response regulator transcription factor [Rhodocyclaceae bacterium]|nr:response regulator transcription factor [Rhodocyclaceae bacterium]